MQDVLADNSARWERQPPASQHAIDSLRAAVPWKLPAEYLAFLSYSNGGEGELGIRPGWFHIWSAEEVVGVNESYQVAEYHPGYFGFGTSLGGVMCAFDMLAGPPHKVYGIPSDSIDPVDIDLVADDFLAFVRAMGRPWEEGRKWAEENDYPSVVGPGA